MLSCCITSAPKLVQQFVIFDFEHISKFFWLFALAGPESQTTSRLTFILIVCFSVLSLNQLYLTNIGICIKMIASTNLLVLIFYIHLALAHILPRQSILLLLSMLCYLKNANYKIS